MANAIQDTAGIGRAIGCDYLRSRNHLVFVEVNGRLSRIDLRTHAYATLGSGYEQPEDVVVSADEGSVFITERGGALLWARFDAPDRTSALRLASGMKAPHILTIDEERGCAYVVEHGLNGRLLRIDFATGEKEALVEGLENAIGLLMTRDMRFAYISERANSVEARVLRIELETGRRETLMMDAGHPHFLSWLEADAAAAAQRTATRAVTLRGLGERPAAGAL